jgi:S1-C subfamily serine protease
MKRIFQLFIAGILGGAVAFAAFKFFDKNTIVYEEVPARTFTTNSSNPSVSTISTDFVFAANKANPAVVHISARNKEYEEYSDKRRRYDPFEDFFFYRRNEDRPQAGTGSGVIISKDGHIVTNNHVVGFADFISVTTQDGNVYEATKIGTDPSTDLAVIKIEGENFNSLQFSNSDNVLVGEWVVAVGNPFNLTSTVTAGIVSAKGRDLRIIQNQKAIEEFIQTDAVVNPGNSGGALVNLSGDLVGINTAISSPTGVYAGYSFAIPSNLVRIVVDEILETGGDIQRAFLGIQIAEVEDVKSMGVTVNADAGVYVRDYNIDRYGRQRYSSAQYAGVEIGDVIVNVDGSNIDNVEDLREALKFVKVGDTVNVTVLRNGSRKTIPVKLRRGI